MDENQEPLTNAFIVAHYRKLARQYNEMADLIECTFGCKEPQLLSGVETELAEVDQLLSQMEETRALPPKEGNNGNSVLQDKYRCECRKEFDTQQGLGRHRGWCPKKHTPKELESTRAKYRPSSPLVRFGEGELLTCQEHGCGFTTRSQHGMNIHRTKAHGPQAVETTKAPTPVTPVVNKNGRLTVLVVGANPINHSKLTDALGAHVDFRFSMSPDMPSAELFALVDEVVLMKFARQEWFAAALQYKHKDHMHVVHDTDGARVTTQNLLWKLKPELMTGVTAPT